MACFAPLVVRAHFARWQIRAFRSGLGCYTWRYAAALLHPCARNRRVETHPQCAVDGPSGRRAVWDRSSSRSCSSNDWFVLDVLFNSGSCHLRVTCSSPVPILQRGTAATDAELATAFASGGMYPHSSAKRVAAAEAIVRSTVGDGGGHVAEAQRGTTKAHPRRWLQVWCDQRSYEFLLCIPRSIPPRPLAGH
jgi:hypothetical protein